MAAIDDLVRPHGEDSMVLTRYFDYVKGLKFEEEPHYDFMRKLFREVLVKRKEENAPYDWERLGYPRRRKH